MAFVGKQAQLGAAGAFAFLPADFFDALLLIGSAAFD